MAITISGRGAAFGFGKQGVGAAGLVNGTTYTGGNIVLPNATNIYYPRWLDGSMHQISATYAHLYEGDGKRKESLSYKQFQYGHVVNKCNPRPIELAFLTQAFTGTGSNYVGAQISTTGVYPHNIGSPPIDTGNDYYTASSLNTQDITNSGKAKVLQTADALCHRYMLAGQSGQVVSLETEWSGGVNQFYTTSANIPTTIPVSTDAPYYFFNGSWAFSGGASSLSSIVAAIKSFEFTFTTTLTPQDYQAEGIFPLPMVPGNTTFEGKITILWQSWDAFCLAYFGVTSPASSDVQLTTATNTGSGNILLTFSNPNVNGNTETVAAQFEFPNATFEGVEGTPDLSGKPFEQSINLRFLGGTTTTLQTGATPAYYTNVPFAAKILAPAAAAF